MKKELNLFFNAMMYFSRIPCPRNTEYSEEILSKAYRYFPLVGIIVASAASVCLWLSLHLMPLSVSVLIALTVIVLLTGCFHEDGFADFFDGFGGGNTKERTLEIMKDSRIGTFGAMALILLYALKYFSLVSLPEEKIALILISAHSVSRVFPVLLVKSSVYARQTNSKALFSRNRVDNKSLVIAVITGLIPLSLFNFRFIILYVLLSLLFLAAFRHLLHRRIGGFTGDTLGALQQFTEVIFYLTLVSVPPSWMVSSVW